MRMYDLIEKKKRGKELSPQEISWMVRGFTDGEIPDYQMSAMLMAVCFQGMTMEETTRLTMDMAASGDTADLSAISGVKVDKHSTGGVGDKTTLIAGPVAAACGVKVAKMSGRGLGHTGGTIDKLEAIPGFRTDLEPETFADIVNRAGMAVAGQTGNMVPADKKLYALRDVTATVDSIPLIASSVMSKKLASGSDGIVLDVKMGSGAFMKTLDQAVELAKTMVAIGAGAGRRVSALITDMDTPLGSAVGNALEVEEAVNTLKGRGPADLTAVSLALAASMAEAGGRGTYEACLKMARAAVADGSALKCLEKMTEAQGGDARYIKEPERFGRAAHGACVKAPRSGFVASMDAERCGIASVLLKAGRSKKGDAIDPMAGILLQKKTGDFVKQGEVLAEIYASDPALFPGAARELLEAYSFGDEKPEKKPLIFARADAGGVMYF